MQKGSMTRMLWVFDPPEAVPGPGLIIPNKWLIFPSPYVLRRASAEPCSHHKSFCGENEATVWLNFGNEVEFNSDGITRPLWKALSKRFKNNPQLEFRAASHATRDMIGWSKGGYRTAIIELKYTFQDGDPISLCLNFCLDVFDLLGVKFEQPPVIGEFKQSWGIGSLGHQLTDDDSIFLYYEELRKRGK